MTSSTLLDVAPPVAARTAVAIFAETVNMASIQQAVCLVLLRASQGATSGLVEVDAVFRSIPLDDPAMDHSRFPKEDRSKTVLTYLQWLSSKPRKHAQRGGMNLSYQLLVKFDVDLDVVQFEFNDQFLNEIQALASRHEVAAF